MRRRSFLELCTAGTLAASGLTLTGCGTDPADVPVGVNGNAPSGPLAIDGIPSVQTVGRFLVNELPPLKGLTVQSIFQSVEIGDSGEFNLAVSGISSQLLFLMNANGDPISWLMSDPPVVAKLEPISLSPAKEMVKALLMTTFHRYDSAWATLPAFLDLVNYLSSPIKNGVLLVAHFQDTNFRVKLDTLIQAVLALINHPPSIPGPTLSATIIGVQSSDSITLDTLIRNRGWRICITDAQLPSDGTRTPIFARIPGPTALASSDFFDGVGMAPGQRELTILENRPLRAQGPGVGSLAAATERATLANAAVYLFFPLLDQILGSTAGFNFVSTLTDATFSSLVGTLFLTNYSNTLTPKISLGDREGALTACADLISQFLQNPTPLLRALEFNPDTLTKIAAFISKSAAVVPPGLMQRAIDHWLLLESLELVIPEPADYAVSYLTAPPSGLATVNLLGVALYQDVSSQGIPVTMVQDRTRTTPVGPTPGGNFAVGSAPFSPGRSVSSARDILIQHDVAGVAGLQAHFLSATSGGTGPLATSDGTPIFGLDLVQQADNTPLVLGKATVGATTSYYTLKPGSAPALLTVAGQPTAQPVLLNGNGDVAGVIPDPTNLILFIRSAAGVVTVVRTPLLNSGALAGFNNSQQLLYFGQLSNPGITFGYRWKAGTETELKPLNSLANQGVIPTAMNNAGQVVGVTLADRSGPADVRDVATIWSSARVPVVSSIQSITGDAPYTALSISNAGHVVGNLVTAAGVEKGYLLSPI